MIITLVVVLLFYLRLIVNQKGRSKTARLQYAEAAEKSKKKKNVPEPQVKWENVGVRVRNWWLIGVGVVLILFGAIVYGTHFIGPSLSTAWWVPVNVGIIVFAIAVR